MYIGKSLQIQEYVNIYIQSKRVIQWQKKRNMCRNDGLCVYILAYTKDGWCSVVASRFYIDMS